MCDTHDVLHRDSAHRERVSDEGAVAAPRYGFGAHRGDMLLLGQIGQRLHIFRELIGLHVVRVAAERRIAPSHVGRIGASMAQAAESRQVDIADAGSLQRVGQSFPVELGVVARAGHGADIRYFGHAVRLQQADELRQFPGRMPNGKHGLRMF